MPEFSVGKLALFPEKLESVETATKPDGPIDTTYPISVELSLTDGCSFKCVWCSDADLRNRLRGFMRQAALDPLLEDLAEGGTKGIVIEGGGEPTLHPLLGHTIERTRTLGMAAGLITNGYRFNYKDQFNGLEWVRVSLDVASDSQMDALKKQGAFPVVMDNIEEMVRLRGDDTVVGVSYIVTTGSLEGVEEMVRRLSDIGVDYVQIKPVVDHPNLFVRGVDLSHLAQYSTEGFSVYVQAMDDNMITGNGGVPCVANSITTVVAANGDVYFCGRLNTDPEFPPMGNINETRFRDIWLSAERFRQSHLMRQTKECKARCPECRITKFNLALDQIRQGKAKRPIPPQNVRTPNFI